jgi:hypothetical protein
MRLSMETIFSAMVLNFNEDKNICSEKNYFIPLNSICIKFH